MKDAESSSRKIIENGKAAAVLADVSQYVYLEPFVGREATVSQAARELGIRVDAMYYRVKRYFDLGILCLTRSERREGRPVKYYTLCEGGFFVPIEHLPPASLEEWLIEARAYFEPTFAKAMTHAIYDLMTRGDRVGLEVFELEAGKLSVELSTPQADASETLVGGKGTAVMDMVTSVYLDFVDARELQEKLHDLLSAYQSKGGAQQYFLRIGLAPVVEEP